MTFDLVLFCQIAPSCFFFFLCDPGPTLPSRLLHLFDASKSSIPAKKKSPCEALKERVRVKECGFSRNKCALTRNPLILVLLKVNIC